MTKRKPFKKPVKGYAQRALWSLREAGGYLRACALFADAELVERIANELDPHPIKPAPTVYRTVSG